MDGWMKEWRSQCAQTRCELLGVHVLRVCVGRKVCAVGQNMKDCSAEVLTRLLVCLLALLGGGNVRSRRPRWE